MIVDLSEEIAKRSQKNIKDKTQTHLSEEEKCAIAEEAEAEFRDKHRD